jgi:GNAT superfamily N-acetyltransferase
MFNSAGTYLGRFKADMQKEFAERWPDIATAEADFNIDFANAKDASWTYGDCVYLKGQVKNPNYDEKDSWCSKYNVIFSGYIGRLYGNCGAANPALLEVRADLQKRGIGGWLTGWLTRMLSEAGYTVAVGTTIDSMGPMVKLLERNGWKRVEELGFTNRRTHNAITFWRIELPKPTPKPIPSPAPVDHLFVLVVQTVPDIAHTDHGHIGPGHPM